MTFANQFDCTCHGPQFQISKFIYTSANFNSNDNSQNGGCPVGDSPIGGGPKRSGSF